MRSRSEGDGKIVVVGPREPSTDSDFALARYNADGRLDTAFSGDGGRRPPSGGSERRTGWRSRPTAKSSSPVTSEARRSDFALARYNPTARSIRASPATASRRPTSGTSTGRTRWRSRATARSSWPGRRGGDDFALARYNPNGSLDTRFSGDGKRTADIGGIDWAEGVAIQGDGRIVAAGLRQRRRRLRPRPLQPERVARHELLR